MQMLMAQMGGGSEEDSEPWLAKTVDSAD